jgi:predicted DNA-binding transcriptional regulator YafY
MAAPKTVRWLDLIAFLLYHRFPVTREQIFESVEPYKEDWEPAADERARETLRRKFERDKDELRSLGIDIETVPLADTAADEAGLGYRLRPADACLPYLELTRGDPPACPYRGLQHIEVSDADIALLDRATRYVAQLTESPLSRAARSARRKLEFDLPLPLHTVERLLARPLSPESTKTLEVLQRAVASYKAVRCRYYAIGRDDEDEREIEPYGLFFSWGRWYCAGRARDRDALRVFRVDRMRDAKPVGGSAARFQVPKEFSVREYVGRAPWELSGNEPTQVCVRFGFPESRWVQARQVGRVIDPLLDDGGAVFEFGVRDLGPFLRWLLTFRGQAQVLEPRHVATELVELKERVARLYEHEASK